MPLIRERWQSSRWPAPKAWETRVSRPIRRPSPKKAKTMKRLELMLTAPMDSALLGRRPTIMVSTMTMLIQPISARTRGRARRRVGESSRRKVERESMGNRRVYDGLGIGDNEKSGKSETRKMVGEPRREGGATIPPLRASERRWLCGPSFGGQAG